MSRAFQKAARVVAEKGFQEGHHEALDAIFPKGTLARSDLDGLVAVARQAPDIFGDVQANGAQSTDGAAAHTEGPSLENVRAALGRFIAEAADEAQNAFRSTPKGLQEPEFEVLRGGEDFEIRSYPNFTAATRRMPAIDGNAWASAEGFSSLEGYLSGENHGEQVMKMSMPVEIDYNDDEPEVQTMSFVLPTGDVPHHNGLPKPYDPTVQVAEVPERLVAIRRFPGVATAAEAKRQSAMLLKALERSRAWAPVAHGEYSVLQYNPPYTIPWRRRNEVAIVVGATGEADASEVSDAERGREDAAALERARALERQAYEAREAELRSTKEYFEAQNKELIDQVTALAERKQQAEELMQMTEDKLRQSALKEQEMLDSLASRAEEAALLKGELGGVELREAELQNLLEFFQDQNRELTDRVKLLQEMVDSHAVVAEKLAQMGGALGEAQSQTEELRQLQEDLESQKRALAERVEALQEVLDSHVARAQAAAEAAAQMELRLVSAESQAQAAAEEVAQMARRLEASQSKEAELREVQDEFEKKNQELAERVSALHHKEVDLTGLLRLAEAKVARFERREQELLSMVEAREQEAAEMAQKASQQEVIAKEHLRSQQIFDERYQQLMRELNDAHASNKLLERQLHNAEQRLIQLWSKMNTQRK